MLMCSFQVLVGTSQKNAPQVTLAQKIMTEAALYAYDLRSSDAELNAVVTKFEQAPDECTMSAQLL